MRGRLKVVTLFTTIIPLLLGGCVTTSSFFKEIEQVDVARSDAIIIKQLDSGKLKVNEELRWNGRKDGIPIDHAVLHGRANLVKELIKRGADLNRIEPSKSPLSLSGTPLETAIRLHFYEIAEDLVLAGARLPENSRYLEYAEVTEGRWQDPNYTMQIMFGTRTEPTPTAPAEAQRGLQYQLALAVNTLGATSTAYDSDRTPRSLAHYPFESRAAANLQFLRNTLNRMAKAGMVPDPVVLLDLAYNYQQRQKRLEKYPQIKAAYLEALNLLLNAGADPWFVEERTKSTALTNLALAGSGVDAPINLLVKKAVEKKAVQSGAGKSREAIRREYLNRCLPVAKSALNNAVTLENIPAVTALLKLGADPNQLCQTTFVGKTTGDKYSDRMSALQWAVLNNKMEIARTLVAFGANPKLKTENGKSLDELAVIRIQFNERTDDLKARQRAEQAQAERQKQLEAERAARERQANIKGALAIGGAVAIGSSMRGSGYTDAQRSAAVRAYTTDVMNGTGGSNMAAVTDQIKTQRMNEQQAQMRAINELRAPPPSQKGGQGSNQTAAVTGSTAKSSVQVAQATPVPTYSGAPCGPNLRCTLGYGQRWCDASIPPTGAPCEEGCTIRGWGAAYHDTSLPSNVAYIPTGKPCAERCTVANKCR